MEYVISCDNEKSRSDVLANWDDNDVRNLHQWGVWVESSVNDLEEGERAKLKQAVSLFYLSPVVCDSPSQAPRASSLLFNLNMR